MASTAHDVLSRDAFNTCAAVLFLVFVMLWFDGMLFRFTLLVWCDTCFVYALLRYWSIGRPNIYKLLCVPILLLLSRQLLSPTRSSVLNFVFSSRIRTFSCSLSYNCFVCSFVRIPRFPPSHCLAAVSAPPQRGVRDCNSTAVLHDTLKEVFAAAASSSAHEPSLPNVHKTSHAMCFDCGHVLSVGIGELSPPAPHQPTWFVSTATAGCTGNFPL